MYLSIWTRGSRRKSSPRPRFPPAPANGRSSERPNPTPPPVPGPVTAPRSATAAGTPSNPRGPPTPWPLPQGRAVSGHLSGALAEVRLLPQPGVSPHDRRFEPCQRRQRMQLDVAMQKIVKIRVPDDTLNRVLTGIAEAAVKNKKHGLAVEAVEVLPPEVIDWPEGGTRLRYAGRVRLRQSKAKSPEKALKGFRYAFAMLAKRAKGKGWEVLGEPPGDPGSLPAATRPPRPPFPLPDMTPEVINEAFAGIYERDAHVRIIHDAARTFVATGRRQASHVLLHGEPAAAKSTLFGCF